MPNTTNFNWPTPADTDLVKDGAAAIRNLGDGVDTSLVDLKGGTTGQILSKASNADMDFAFITPNVGDLTEVQAGTGISVADGTGPIPIVTNTVATAFDAKGDLVVGTGADTFAKLTVGTDGHTLVAKSSEATGLAWEAPAAASGPAFRAFRNTSQQSFNQNTWTKVQLNGESFDTDSCFDSSTNYRFTPTKAGYYQYNSRLWISKTGQSLSQSAIYKNGAQESTAYSWTNTGTGFILGGSDLLYMNGTTDYVELYVYDSDPSGRGVVESALNSFFSGVWIRS
jgi:hypothetical protein